MPVDFRQVSVNIPAGTGRRTIQSSVRFASTVNRAVVVLNGLKLDYVHSDHHINLLEVATRATAIIDFLTVHFKIEAAYADQNHDDPYRGYVTVTVIADVAEDVA
jgi:hypothetical protein